MAITVTIARQHGSGGPRIGREVSRLLDANYLDKELITYAARRGGVAEEEVTKQDELAVRRRAQVLHLVLDSLADSDTGEKYPYYFSPKGLDASGPSSAEVDQERYLELITGVMTDLARAHSAVIIGRGGNMILRNSPNVLRVFLLAPVDVRIKRIMAWDHLSRKEANKLIDETDKRRAEFVRQLFKVDWGDPLNYDVVLNTGEFSFERVARIIADIARDKVDRGLLLRRRRLIGALA